MADSLLNIYGNYDNAYRKYVNQATEYNKALDDYLGKVDAYNELANLYNENIGQLQSQYQGEIDAYNSTIISDPGAYRTWFGGQSNDYQGNGPYTMYAGNQVGRTNPYETYYAQRGEEQYNEDGESLGASWYDPRTGLGKNPEGGAFDFSYANENAYLDPSTGLVSLFKSRPGAFNPPAFTGVDPGQFTMETPLAPNAPPEQAQGPLTGNVRSEELYQKTFGRSTPDVLSNEAWGLSNISTPFLNSEPENAYEIGGVAAINNPLSYVGPDSLTSGNTGVDQNTLMAGKNPYYMT